VDPRFVPYTIRCAHGHELRQEIERALSAMTVEHSVAALTAAGVPAAPVNTVREALAHPPLRARKMVVTEEDGFATIASPIHLQGYQQSRQAPRQGEHDQLISGWLAEPVRGG
jgi:CoA:oxalate CoA-transferase